MLQILFILQQWDLQKSTSGNVIDKGRSLMLNLVNKVCNNDWLKLLSWGPEKPQTWSSETKLKHPSTLCSEWGIYSSELYQHVLCSPAAGEGIQTRVFEFLWNTPGPDSSWTVHCGLLLDIICGLFPTVSCSPWVSLGIPRLELTEAQRTVSEV